MSTDDRAAYISGGRKWFDFLEAHPEIPVPGHASHPSLPQIIYFSGEDAREQMAATRKAIGGDWDKGVDEKWFKLHGRLDGFYLQLYAVREEVCTARVTGTEMQEVEEEVTPAVTRKVTKEVDVIEWDCGPLLDPSKDAGASA